MDDRAPIRWKRCAARAAQREAIASWAPKMLVIVQAAVSVVLLSAAAMLGQSLRNLEHQDFGFDPGAVISSRSTRRPPNYRQDQLLPLYREIEDRLRSFPDVHSAGSVLEAPMAGWVWPHDIRIQGKPEPGLKDDDSSGWTRVTPGFFETLGDKIVMGRPIAEGETRIRGRWP